MSTIKKTATRVKFDGMTFLHYDKCIEGNHFPKEYLILNGVRYFKVKNVKDIENIPDEVDAEHYTVELPTAAELKALEADKQMIVNEQGSLSTETKESIKYDPKYPGRKTKARFLNPKNGNYVSYIRAIQLKLV
jgi:hypothetical protein